MDLPRCKITLASLLEFAALATVVDKVEIGVEAEVYAEANEDSLLPRLAGIDPKLFCVTGGIKSEDQKIHP